MTPKRKPSDWERLKRRLIEELHLDIVPWAQLYRNYPGHWQRSQGVWTWFVMDRRGHDYGSQTPVKVLVKAKKLTLSDRGEIDDS